MTLQSIVSTATRAPAFLLGDVDSPFSIEWYLDQGIQVVPTWPSNPKNTEKGYTKASICTAADFSGGRWAKIVTGQQIDTLLFLYAFDEDKCGILLPLIERYTPELLPRFLRARSTEGRGLHLWFYTSRPIETFIIRDPNTGESLIEFKGCGAWLTAPRPETIIEYGYDSFDFPFIPFEQLQPLLDGIRPAPKPAVVRPATAGSTVSVQPDARRTSFDIRAYCRSIDLPALVEADGAVYAGENNGVMHYHCHGAAHAHGDRNPSLRVYSSDKYGYVVKCNHPGCELGQGPAQNAFDYQRNRRGLSAADFLKEINPLDNAAIARAKDAERKRTERACGRDTRLGGIRARLQADTNLPERAHKLVDLLLADGLQSRKTNAQLAEMLSVHPNTITNAFRDLVKHGYGRRVGGFRFGDKCEPAVWTFLDHKATDDKPLVNVPVPIDCDLEKGELVILKESKRDHNQPAAHVFSFPFPLIQPETEKREKEKVPNLTLLPGDLAPWHLTQAHDPERSEPEQALENDVPPPVEVAELASQQRERDSLRSYVCGLAKELDGLTWLVSDFCEFTTLDLLDLAAYLENEIANQAVPCVARARLTPAERAARAKARRQARWRTMDASELRRKRIILLRKADQAKNLRQRTALRQQVAEIDHYLALKDAEVDEVMAPLIPPRSSAPQKFVPEQRVLTLAVDFSQPAAAAIRPPPSASNLLANLYARLGRHDDAQRVLRSRV